MERYIEITLLIIILLTTYLSITIVTYNFKLLSKRGYLMEEAKSYAYEIMEIFYQDNLYLIRQALNNNLSNQTLKGYLYKYRNYNIMIKIIYNNTIIVYNIFNDVKHEENKKPIIRIISPFYIKDGWGEIHCIIRGDI